MAASATLPMTRLAFSLVVFALVIAGSAPAQVLPAVSQKLLTRAESGDAAAQFELGRAYEDGKGVPQDDDRAVEWFRKAASRGKLRHKTSWV
jgi:TPR repeat protein